MLPPCTASPVARFFLLLSFKLFAGEEELSTSQAKPRGKCLQQSRRKKRVWKWQGRGCRLCHAWLPPHPGGSPRGEPRAHSTAGGFGPSLVVNPLHGSALV